MSIKLISDEAIVHIVTMRNGGAEYKEISDSLKQTFGIDRSVEATRAIYRRNTDEVNGKMLKSNFRISQTNTRVARENKAILKEQIQSDDLMLQIKDLAKGMRKIKVRPAPPKAKSKTAMTMEAMISDVHVGKKTEEFNLEVCRRRLRHFSEVFIGEIGRNQKNYNVERLILSFLGDNIENARMHGIESMVGCEFGNPEQVRHCIDLFTTEILVPIARLGIPIDVICISGNHCREGEHRTYHLPGKYSLSWIVYQSMKMLAEGMGLRNVTWHIPEGVYFLANIYGNKVLYEHGDNVKGTSVAALNTHIANRGTQLGEIIHGIRLGHFHRYTHYDNGRVVINASVCGADSYSDVLGYTSNAGQVINFYVKTANRPSSFYHSFLVQLN